MRKTKHRHRKNLKTKAKIKKKTKHTAPLHGTVASSTRTRVTTTTEEDFPWCLATDSPGLAAGTYVLQDEDIPVPPGNLTTFYIDNTFEWSVTGNIQQLLDKESPGVELVLQLLHSHTLAVLPHSSTLTSSRHITRTATLVLDRTDFTGPEGGLYPYAYYFTRTTVTVETATAQITYTFPP